MASRSTLYTTEILRLAASLPEPVRLERVDGAGEARSATCGSVVATEVALGPDRRIAALSQRVQACAFGQASAALVAAGAAGKRREEVDAALDLLTRWLAGEGEAPEWPAVAALAPARSRGARHGAILLPLRALVAAIEDAR